VFQDPTALDFVDGSIDKQHDNYMSLTVDDTTFASQPGAIQISVYKYLDYHKCQGFTRMFYGILLSIPKTILFKLFKWNETVYDWIVTCELFALGCVNPSIIINKEKGIVATFTDLTCIGDSSTPVVKVSVQPLHLIKNMKAKNGQRISTVALYFRDMEHKNATAWKDFHPLVPNCFTDDMDACLSCLEKIRPQAWTDLEFALTQVADKEKEGLYHVEMSH
jgi:hypothetical protein